MKAGSPGTALYVDLLVHSSTFRAGTSSSPSIYFCLRKYIVYLCQAVLNFYPTTLGRNFLVLRYTWLLFVWPEMRLQRVAIVQGDGDASKTVVPIHNSPLSPSPIDGGDEASTIESPLSDANCFFWHIQLPLRVISAYQGQECSSSSLD